MPRLEEAGKTETGGVSDHSLPRWHREGVEKSSSRSDVGRIPGDVSRVHERMYPRVETSRLRQQYEDNAHGKDCRAVVVGRRGSCKPSPRSPVQKL